MARHYAFPSGRFMTPDPGHVEGNSADPQSWNAYANSRNDPINLVDPSGLTYLVCAWNESCGDGFQLSDFDFDSFVTEHRYSIDGNSLLYYGDPVYFFFRISIDGPGTLKPWEPPNADGPIIGNVIPVPEPPPTSNDPCLNLYNQMVYFAATLISRFYELRTNPLNLPMNKPLLPDSRTGFRSIMGERQQFKNWQNGLRNRFNEFKDRGNCGGPPPGVLVWKSVPVPAPTARQLPQIAPRIMHAAEGLGTAYVIYRALRMIPSLAVPPLWPTIPANALVP